MKYTVYSTKTCPRCEQLKKMLSDEGIKFKTLDMASSEALTELRVNGVFTLSAPVLQAGEDFFTVDDLFEGERLRSLKALGLA